MAKHQRRLAGFDEAVISLYAKGMTTGDIAARLSEVCDTMSPVIWSRRCSTRSWPTCGTGRPGRWTPGGFR